MNEQVDVLYRFLGQLAKATGDGGEKRARGEKPPWYEDDSHEAAMFSHLMKWKKGETTDKDSGAHPLVHLAWRALAIACRETGDVPKPRRKAGLDICNTKYGPIFVEYMDNDGTVTTGYETEVGGAGRPPPRVSRYG